MATCNSILRAIGLCLLLGTLAQAETVTLDPVDRGWYNDAEYHNPDNQSYFVGAMQNTATTSTLYRNFFVFDLATVAGRVTAADLVVHTLLVSGGDQTYDLYDVTTPISALVNSTGSAFNDLGSGVLYGSRIISGSVPEDNIETIPLNQAFITAANNATGLFAFGGTLGPSTAAEICVFGSVDVNGGPKGQRLAEVCVGL